MVIMWSSEILRNNAFNYPVCKEERWSSIDILNVSLKVDILSLSNKTD